MEIGRKYCTRCNRGIYTTWRTLDDKKYYHPHCFTCADCGVILESVQQYEVATATQNEIYCGRCHNERFPVYKTDVRRVDNDEGLYGAASSTRTFGQQTPNLPSGHYFNNLHADGNNNIDIIFSSSSPFCSNEDNLVHNEQFIKGVMRNTKKKVKAPKSEQIIPETKSKTIQRKKSGFPSAQEEVSSTTASMHVQQDRYGLESKTSRIPRPTSAHSKKSLTTTATQSGLIPTKVKASRGQLEKTKNSALRLPPSSQQQRTTVTPKMYRSMSSVQTRNMEATGNSFSVSTKPNRASSHVRPRSAVSTAWEEKLLSMSEQQGVRSSASNSSNSKRQCAASFGTRKKKDSKAHSKQPQFRKDNEEYPVDNYPQMKGGIPSTQAILTAIRRGGSEALKLKPSSRIQLANSESYDVPVNRTTHTNNAVCQSDIPTLPKRSFNMTFECPICISSLVPGSTGNEIGGPDSKGQCRNVVTPCGHLFHANCMQNWLEIKGNKRCPICSALCLPETLQPVYLECNLCADLNPNPKALLVPVDSQGGMYQHDYKGMHEMDASFRTLRSEYELLKAKYNAVLSENHNYSLNATLASSLQRAYDMECRHRLQLQWENRKLLMKVEELQNLREGS